MKRDELESSELLETPWPPVLGIYFGPANEDDVDADDSDGDGDARLD